MLETILSELTPDWSFTNCSLAELTNDLGEFPFDGPGWYSLKSDTILIQVVGPGKYSVHCWNDPSFHSEFLKWIEKLLGVANMEIHK